MQTNFSQLLKVLPRLEPAYYGLLDLYQSVSNPSDYSPASSGKMLLWRNAYKNMSVTIAIVDDDEAILDSVKMLLEGVGWPTRIYATGEALLEDLKTYTPTCVILDPHLPGISGAVIAGALKPNIPFIVLTARPKSVVTNAVENAGSLVTMIKPVSSEALLEHVLDAVAGGSEDIE